MSKDFRYFKVTGGAVRTAHDSFIATRVRQITAIATVKSKYGATNTFGNTDGISALEFTQPPSGWRPVKGARGFYKPPIGNAGKVIREELANLKLADASEYHRGVPRSNGFGYIQGAERGLRIRYIVFEKIGDTLVLLVPDCPDAAKWAPPDEHCLPLKQSEYWALKEAHQATTERAAA